MKEGGAVVITGLTRNQNKKAPQNKKTNSRLTCNDRSLMDLAQGLNKSRNSTIVICRTCDLEADIDEGQY